ncbi:hypothetical protein ACWDWU_40515 [Streptomyces sp. NPDC003442]
MEAGQSTEFTLNLAFTGEEEGYYQPAWVEVTPPDETEALKIEWSWESDTSCCRRRRYVVVPAVGPDSASCQYVWCQAVCTAPRTSAFSVLPGGPPDVTLTRALGVGYPGVRPEAKAEGTVARQNVSVRLSHGHPAW